MRAAMAFGVTPFCLASVPKLAFHLSKLAPVLPHLAASAALATTEKTAAITSNPVHLPSLIPSSAYGRRFKGPECATKPWACHRSGEMASEERCSHAKAAVCSNRGTVSDARLSHGHSGCAPAQPRPRAKRP